MGNQTLYSTPEWVKMDENHIDLIYSLIICNKPKTILEIGVGTGAVSLKALQACEYNEITPQIVCVDNFFDWKGKPPREFEEASKKFQFVISDEKSFVKSCKDSFDFIISDADHHHTHEWVESTYSLLNKGGILIYHDVTNRDFPNLFGIVNWARKKGVTHMCFNSSSKPNERCERGLLVIKKD